MVPGATRQEGQMETWLVKTVRLKVLSLSLYFPFHLERLQGCHHARDSELIGGRIYRFNYLPLALFFKSYGLVFTSV